MRTIKARVIRNIGTESAWLQNDRVLGDGEVAYVRFSLKVRYKIGDGIQLFSALGYQDPALEALPVTPGTNFSTLPPGLYIPKGSGLYNGVQINTENAVGFIYWDGELVDPVMNEIDFSGEYIPNNQKGSAEGVATLGSDIKVPATQLPLSYGASPNGQLLNPANTLPGLGIGGVTYNFFFNVEGAIAVWFPVEPNTQITISWSGGNVNNRFVAYVDENRNPISSGGANNLGHTINNRLGTVTTPNNPAIKGAYIQTARSTTNEPVPPTWVKVQLGASATDGHEFQGGVEKISGSVLNAEYAKNLVDKALINIVSESELAVINKQWIFDQINSGIVDNGQLLNPENNQAGAVTNQYIISNNGTNSQGIHNIIDLTTPELASITKFYYSDFGGWVISQRFNMWEDINNELIQGFTQTSDGVIERPEGAAYLVVGVKRPNATEPEYTGQLKIQPGEFKTAGLTYGGDKIHNIFGMGLDVAGYTETEGILYMPKRLYFVKGLKIPIYKTSLVRHVEELQRDIVFSNPAVTYTDFNKPVYYSLSAESWVDPDIMGTYGHVWTKDYNKPDEMRGVRVDLSVVDPATKDGITFNLICIGDSIPSGVFNSSVNPLLAHINPTITKIQHGTRQIANTNNANDFRPAFSYSVYTGRSNRLGNYSGAPTISPATDASQLNGQYVNPFLRLATATDKANRPDWCFRSTGAFEELSYSEDPIKTGDFWIFDFAHYLTWLSNPQVDVIYIALGSNDLLFFQSKGIEYAEAGLRRMLTSIMEVVPTAKIGVVPSPGRGESNDIWQMHCDWMSRLNIILADFPNVDQVPLHPYINRNFSYPLTGPNPIEGLEEGNNTRQWVKGDEVHIQTNGGVEYGRAVVSWLMNVI